MSNGWDESVRRTEMCQREMKSKDVIESISAFNSRLAICEDVI